MYIFNTIIKDGCKVKFTYKNGYIIMYFKYNICVAFIFEVHSLELLITTQSKDKGSYLL